jgi:hypothetical protein
VSSSVSGTGGDNFGRFLYGRRLGGVGVVKEGIVIETSRELGRDGTCHQNDNDSHLSNIGDVTVNFKRINF